MGKRYYCDYCNKSFADNPVSRKTHLNGIVHAQNKKAHYDSLRDEEEILKDESNKRPCRAFLSSGQCKFGDRCQYSHLTNEDKARLAEIVCKKKKIAEARLQEISKEDNDSSTNQSLNMWIKKRAEKRAIDKSIDDGPVSKKLLTASIPEYQLATCLLAMPNLPPSLLPPTKEELLFAEYTEWG